MLSLSFGSYLILVINKLASNKVINFIVKLRCFKRSFYLDDELLKTDFFCNWNCLKPRGIIAFYVNNKNALQNLN